MRGRGSFRRSAPKSNTPQPPARWPPRRRATAALQTVRGNTTCGTLVLSIFLASGWGGARENRGRGLSDEIPPPPLLNLRRCAPLVCVGRGAAV
jgi:hypothetical protein